MKFLAVRPIYGIMAFALFGLLFGTLPIFLLTNGFILIGIIFLVLWLVVFFFGVVHNCFIKNIEISKDGVKYSTLFKMYKMSWQEINVIGIGYVPIRKPGAKPWIYFSGINLIMPTLAANMVNERFFMVNYRKSILDEVRKFWTGEIVGFERL